MKSTLLLFILGAVNGAKLNPVATKLANECFTPIFRRGISNSAPIAELWNVSPFDCMSYCILNAVKTGDGCSSVVYHKHFQTCQLYNHDGTYDGAKVVFASGHDYYNRTSFSALCSDPLEPTRPYPQRHPKAHTDNNVHSSQPISAKSKQTKPEKKPEHYLLALEPKRDCRNNETRAYITMEGYGIPKTISPKAIINNIDREACSNYCTQNINAVGDRSGCIAFTHDSIEERCELHDESIKEIGIFSRVEIDSSHFTVAEKICIDKELKCEDGISNFKLVHKKKISDYVLGQLVNLETITDCLKICLDNRMCKSVTFKNGRCTLHSVLPLPQNLADADSSTSVLGKTCEKF